MTRLVAGTPVVIRLAPVSTPTSLVRELRSLIEVVRTADLDAAAIDLEDLEGRLAEVRGRLEPHVIDEVRMQAGLHSADRAGGTPGQLPDLTGVAPEEFFPYSPIIGPLNPVAPGFRFWTDGEHLRGSGRFGSAHNGPPGGAHGGLVAALMDELLGVTGVMTGNHGFTGTLSIRYESLTPIDTDLDLHAWVERVDGRKSYIVGDIRVGDTVCARGEGVFIRPRPD
jgi:acyl-coenzyme A thioesterase PaaI-like protein